MNILITGICGFAGYHLYNLLSEKGNKIYGLDEIMKNEQHYKNARIYQCDINDQMEVYNILKECSPDQIYHLAAYVHVGRVDIESAKLFKVNVAGTITLLDGVRKVVPGAKLLISGSAEEYGIVKQEEMPIKESSRLLPRNLYGLSKKFQEEAGLYYQRTYGLNISFTRTFHYCGPYQPLNFVFSDFGSQVAQIERGDKAIIQVGNLKAERDFTDIRDVVSAYEMIMEKSPSGEVYNVSSGKAVAMEEVLKKMVSYSKRKIVVKIDQDKMRPLDVPIFLGDNSKIRSLGWMQQLGLDDSIKDILNDWRKRTEEDAIV